MESTQTLPDRNAQAPDVKEDKTLERLLLSRVLIEEYQALDQPKVKEFENLKEETTCGGDTIKRIYQLIYKAQRRRVREVRKQCEARYQDQLADEPRKELVDGAVLAEVSTAKDGVVAISEDEAKAGLKTEVDLMAAKTLRSALCLSGGGIRSATFNLGILQGLARHGLLEKFDYLSTVSGGGFIGGWLSAWKHRSGLKTVVDELSKPPKSPLEPDPDPIEHLRVYSNYLSPSPGLLSADTWALIATLVRNLLLNWLVFIPVLLAFLVVPRMWASIVLRSGVHPLYAIWWSWWIGFIAAVVALSYIALNLPSSNSYESTSKKRYKVQEVPFLIFCLLWLVISAAAFSVFLWKWHLLGYEPMLWRSYAKFGLAIVVIPWVLCVIKVFLTTPRKDKRKRVFPVIAATGLIVLVQLIIGYLASAAVIVILPVFYDHGIPYSIFSVPLVLVLMGLEAVLLTGFTSRLSSDEDQEWWARSGAWVLIAALAWILVHSLVLYGPLIILNLETTFRNLTSDGGLRNLEWADWGKIAATVMGVVSGIVTLFGGFSAKTPANSKEAQKAGTGGLLLALLTSVLAPIFLAFVIILLSLATDWLLVSRPAQYVNHLLVGQYLPLPFTFLSTWHCMVIEMSPFRLLVIVFLVLFLLGALTGRLISTNVFSLQYMWRNRIIRAYLGASHTPRQPNPFTNFDRNDNLHMWKLWPQPVKSPATEAATDQNQPKNFLPKLFHVLNIALNLTGGEKLQWQDRKAESFTVSPLHAGSYWLGYRRSAHYGGSITLGASVAVSGAFVSPNMGFMMTSAVVRFLMALFNVRFGWWFGNPGPAGDESNIIERVLNVPARLLGFEVKRPFRLDSPRLSVIPFLSEATGNIDDKSSYVYLSDGGHFENLGLYEMVLRRCRFIVVCDATTDPDYSFESLAMSIRQIRVDLGVPIDLRELAVGEPAQNLKNKYSAIGTIRYSCVDRDPDDKTTTPDDFDGILIFIKPSLIGGEPRDVINYWQSRSTFPQEVITDQWFSEAQFESYRALGSRIIDAICEGDRNQVTLAAFAEKVREHNSLNFSAFNEEIGLVALQEAFKADMRKADLPSYRAKVNRFMNELLR